MFNLSENSRSMRSYFFRCRMKYSMRIAYIFIILTLLTFLYYFQIVQFGTNTIIISLFPSSFLQIKDTTLIHESLNAQIKENSHIKHESPTNIDQIKRLFVQVAKQHAAIQQQLTMPEVAETVQLQKRIEALIIAKKEEQTKEYLQEKLNEKKQKDLVTSAEAANVTNTEDIYDDLELDTKLEENNFLNRDQLVKILKLEKYKLHNKIRDGKVESIRTLLKKYDKKNLVKDSDLPALWHKYFLNINELNLYNNSDTVDRVLQSMATSETVSCYEKEKGTQIKMVMKLKDGTDVLIKPMKVNRDYETPPDHFYFSDFERHHAEIASFHVDMLLGFYRTPPTVGRKFNIKSDIWDKADKPFAKTFFYSPAGNTCFTGHCSYYCDTSHATCGRPYNNLEASVQLMLPNKPLIKWEALTHPYRRSYSKKKRAEWEDDQNYCSEQVIQDIDYQGKLLLDLIDMSIFDFIIGNMDRHHYERMITLSNTTFVLHLDNGRAFGKRYNDEISILTPMTQCCLIRYSTFERLKYLFSQGFSRLLDKSLKKDPLYPVLTNYHLEAIDRRLETVLAKLSHCAERLNVKDILVDDGY